MSLPQPRNPIDEQILGHIRQIGWSVMHIPGGPEGIGFTYTCGLKHSWKHPELVVLGLPTPSSHRFLSAAVEKIKKGQHYQPNLEEHGLIVGYPCQIHPVPRERYEPFLLFNTWLYPDGDFEALQLVWPDQHCKFPDDPDYDRDVAQFVLRADWPFLCPPFQQVLTTRAVANGESVQTVAHELPDGDWQFHTGSPPRRGDRMLMPFQEIVAQDPSLKELADMPAGWLAHRTSPTSPWLRRVNTPMSSN